MITHTAPISGIAAFQDQMIATAGYDNQIVLWELPQRTPISRAFHDHLVNQCSFSPDGTRLVTSSSDYSARLWSVPDLRLTAVLGDHDDDVEMAVFHPTRQLVATASRDSLVRVFDFDGRLQHRFAGHTADVISVEWARDGDGLVTSSDDGTVKRWSMAQAGLVDDIDLGGVETDTIVVGEDEIIFAGNDSGEILMVSNGTRTVTSAHKAGVKRLVLNTELGLLASLSYDRTMALWRIGGTGDLTRLSTADLPTDVWPRSAAFTGSSRLVFGTFGASYRTYDYQEHRWLDEDVPTTYGLNAACAHGDAVLSVGDAGIVWRTLGGVHDEQSRPGSLCNFLMPATSVVITGGQLGTVFDALSGRRLHQHHSPLNTATILHRDGAEYVLIGAYTGEGILLRTGTEGWAEQVSTFPMHANAIKGVAASDDVIFSVCADGSAAWHSVATLELIHRQPRAHDKIANGCVHLGGSRFVSISRDLMLRIWDADRTVTVVNTPHRHSIKCVSADVTGRFVATGSYDGSIAVYDRQTDTWPVTVRPTASGISSMAYDTKRDVFLASSYDGAVYEVPTP
ncbi:WD40 repeat domain-containing protein [Nonomuraea sp. NPDC026600]|uniref:WD40 repeat domain-containing protein n=1 Tax=Nonomuraea sp. NPDC026600 TaxID=3155363 RepID=UPI0033E55D8C